MAETMNSSFEWLPENFEAVKNYLEARFDACETIIEVESTFQQLKNDSELTVEELDFVSVFADRRKAQLKTIE